MRVERLAAGDVDAALCLLPHARLVRVDAGTFFACPSELAGDARILLARAGLRTASCDALPEPPRHFVAARAEHLEPVLLAGAVDTLDVRVLGTGEAADRLRPRHPFRHRRSDVDRVRAVLRGEDRLIGWRRVLWADRAQFRGRTLPGIRPVVFDRDAVSGGEERWTFARAGALGRWLRT